MSKVDLQLTLLSVEIWIVFARNNAVKAAQDILLQTQPPDNVQQKVSFSTYHFRRSQIFRELGLKEEAINELEVSRRTESEYQGYEITSNYVNYLEEYFLLGEREKAVEMIDKIFEFLMKDVSISLMRIPIPQCLFKTNYDEKQHPEYYELQNFLKSTQIQFLSRQAKRSVCRKATKDRLKSDI